MAEPAVRPVPPVEWRPLSFPEGQERPVERLAREILERCRGEGPANCVARCPLHVDARGYVQLTAQGKYREALQLVREKLPFPGVLGYVCAHPCEAHCKRIDEDEPVRIRDIKRFLAEWEPGEPQHLVDCEPDRGRSVAVVGAGPAGLLAAHDLRRRGYAVTVFERTDRIGGCLVWKIPPYRLPRGIVERDLSVIAALGIPVETGVEVGADVALEELRERFDAVLLLVGREGAVRILSRTDPGLVTPEGRLIVDPLTCATALEGVFAGGDAVSGPGTVISALALGRRAAGSAMRFLEGRDLQEDREPLLPPRLLWTLEIPESERKRRQRTPVMLTPPPPPLDETAARQEAERCLDCTCGLCVQDCEFLEDHCDSPRDIARRVLEDPDDPEVLKTTYSCNICSLCAAVCPEGLDTGALLLEARREAVRRGTGPLPVHKGIVSYWKAGVGNTFTTVMPEPGRRTSRRLFFTGCALPAVSPANTLRVYDELRKHYPGTGVMMYCCGAPVELLGMDAEFHQTREDILRLADQVGADELVAACPDCAHTLKEAVPELTITTVWELLAGKWQPPRREGSPAIAIHDSCKARHAPEITSSVRRILEDGGAAIEEIEYNGELARCCGFGGMIYPVDPELSQRVSRRRAEETPLPQVTYCAGCRMAIAGVGKPAVHILDFLMSGDWEKAAAKKAPGSVTRYANRLRTKWAFRRLKPLATD